MARVGHALAGQLRAGRLSIRRGAGVRSSRHGLTGPIVARGGVGACRAGRGPRGSCPRLGLAERLGRCVPAVRPGRGDPELLERGIRAGCRALGGGPRQEALDAGVLRRAPAPAAFRSDRHATAVQPYPGPFPFPAVADRDRTTRPLRRSLRAPRGRCRRAGPWLAPWPAGHSWAVVLTHDVETDVGLPDT